MHDGRIQSRKKRKVAASEETMRSEVEQRLDGLLAHAVARVNRGCTEHVLRRASGRTMIRQTLLSIEDTPGWT